MLIKRIFLLIIFGLFTFVLCYLPASAMNVSAECAVVMNAETFEVVYQKNPHMKRSMASTTKIMTSLLAIESGRLDDTVTVRMNTLPEGTSIGAKQGYKYKLEDLVYGMLLESGNDAALITAEYLCGNERSFADSMNRKADTLGMKSSNFVTSSGLDDNKHYSTAYDMALLGAYAIKNEKFREICSTKTKCVKLIKPDISVTFSNHNRLLKSCDGVFGIKTGFTKKSGRCLVTACKRNGVTYVISTLNAPDDWNDHQKLYDYAFSETRKFRYTFAGFPKIKVYGGNIGEISVSCNPLVISYVKKGDYNTKIVLQHFVYAPLKKGEKLGEIRIISGDKMIYSGDIYSDMSVLPTQTNKRPKKSFFKKIIGFIKK